MVKYFTYNISDFTGYRLKVEESNLNSFVKMVYVGFKIIRSSKFFIHYEIDLKLIRNLKLKKIADLIRRNSIEDRILQLIERSLEVEKDFIYPSSSSSGYFGNFGYFETYYSGTYYYDDEEVEYNKSQNKDRNKYQSKIYAQKAKNYENKARFRK